jgi:alpha-mannosidase
MLRGTYSAVGFTRGGKPVLIQVPPAGKYVFRYSLSAGKGDWAALKPHRAGIAFSTSLIPVCAHDELASKSLLPTRSFCKLGADNLIVTALKKAESAEAVVLRVFETDGAKAETPIEFLGRKGVFRAANLLEEEMGSGKEQTLRLRPYEITTVRLATK